MSNLVVSEKCQLYEKWLKEGMSRRCDHCVRPDCDRGTGTISRPATGEEIVEVAERCFKKDTYLREHIFKLLAPEPNPEPFILKSGARVTLGEKPCTLEEKLNRLHQAQAPDSLFEEIKDFCEKSCPKCGVGAYSVKEGCHNCGYVKEKP